MCVEMHSPCMLGVAPLLGWCLQFRSCSRAGAHCRQRRRCRAPLSLRSFVAPLHCALCRQGSSVLLLWREMSRQERAHSGMPLALWHTATPQRKDVLAGLTRVAGAIGSNGCWKVRRERDIMLRADGGPISHETVPELSLHEM
jgi:hypothetical protein